MSKGPPAAKASERDQIASESEKARTIKPPMTRVHFRSRMKIVAAKKSTIKAAL